MAKKRKRAIETLADPVDSDDDEFEDEEMGTQSAQGNPHMNNVDDRSQAEKDLSEQEKVLKRQREADQEAREKASAEYEEKMAEAEEAAAKEERPEDADKPPEACEQFEGYGDFIVPGTVNIRHQDKKKGDHVALTWEDYQALRDQKIYCVPVPKPEEQERPGVDNTLPV